MSSTTKKKAPKKILQVENLVKIYNQTKVVEGVSFEIRSGEIVGLLGPNGAGKTTSFYMTVGFVRENEGKVILNGKDITSLPMYKRASLGIGYLPQESSIFRKLTVAQNIQAVLELKCKKRNIIKKETELLIEELNLQRVAYQKGFTLSGGERRRCEIARCLAARPTFILFDEPFAGIDPISVIEIQSLLRWLAKQGLGILITDHNVRETLKITSRSYVIYDGKILSSGSSKKLIADPEIKKKYLGKNFYL